MTGAALGVDVGGTFTDLVALVDGRRRDREGPVDAGGPVARASWRPSRRPDLGAIDRVRPRHDGGDERAAGAPRRAHGARDDRGLPRRARDRPPGPRRTSTTSRAAARPRSCRATCASACASGWAPTASCEPLDEERRWPRSSPRCARPRSRRSRSACCSRFLHPEHEQRVGEAVREALPDAHVSLSQRGAAGGPRVRAHRHDGRRRVPRAAARRLPARARPSGRRDAGLPAPRVMQSSGGVVDLEDGRRARGELRALRARPAASSAPPTSRRRERLRRPADLRHGRHEHRRRADRRRRGCRRRTESVVAGVPIRHPTVDVHTVSRRRRLDRLGRRRRRAARRARARAGARARARRLRPRRRGADGDRRQPRCSGYLARRRGARRRRGACSTRALAEAALGRAGLAARPRRAGAALGVVRGRQRRDGARAARHQRRARPRPARVRAGRVRRRGPAARLRAGRGARHRDRARAARQRRPVRARAAISRRCAATTSRPHPAALDGSTATRWRRPSADSRSRPRPGGRDAAARRPTCATAASRSS